MSENAPRRVENLHTDKGKVPVYATGDPLPLLLSDSVGMSVSRMKKYGERS